VINAVLPGQGIPLKALLIYWALALVYVGGTRILARNLMNLRPVGAERVVVYGAGAAGAQAVAALRSGTAYDPVAFLDDDEQIRIVNRLPLERFTERTITDRDALLAHLRTVRSRGWSVDDVEHEEGVRCVGVPVFDNRARVAASISISGPTQRIRQNLLPSLARKARAAALDVSRALGYRGT